MGRACEAWTDGNETVRELAHGQSRGRKAGSAATKSRINDVSSHDCQLTAVILVDDSAIFYCRTIPPAACSASVLESWDLAGG
jgi:hypothetical protein